MTKHHPKTSKEALYLLRRLCKEEGIRIFWDRPLAKGMYQELKDRLGHLMLSGDIYKALGHHTHSHSYLITMKTGTQRFNSKGKVSGVVTEEEARFAHKQRGKLHRKLLNRGKSKGPGGRGPQNKPGTTNKPGTANKPLSRPTVNKPGDAAPTVVIKKKRRIIIDKP